MLRTLRRKILVGYGIGLALMVVVFAWALANLLELGQASEAILRENYNSILAAENMIDAIERQDSGALLAIVGYREDGLQQFRENETEFLQWMGRAKDNITIPGEERVVEAVETGYSAYLVDFSEMLLLHESDPKDAIAFYHRSLLPSFQSVRDKCIELRTVNQETMFAASDRAGRIAGTAIWSMVLVGTAAIAIGLGFSLLLSNLVVRPVRQLVAATHRIAEGDYDVVLPAASSDELGHLSTEFNAMVRKLKSYHDLNIERMLAEQHKSAAVIRSIDDGILVVDDEFRVTDINPAAAEALRLEAAEAVGKHFLEVLNDERLFESVRQAAVLDKAAPVKDAESILTVQDGDAQHHYQFSVTPVHARSGSMLGVVLLLRDVTKLKEVDRLKSEFVMTASHELRTPLTGIGMSIDLLLEGDQKLDDKQRQLLTAAQEEVHRLRALANDLLDLSRIEAGKVEMDLAPVPIHLLFDKAAAVIGRQAQEHGISLAFETGPDLPDVRADPNKITWVLTNLVSNALRYTDSGGHIRATAERVGPQVHISVADDGAGIPYELQPRIFDKFVQAKGEHATGGSGLGLALCREIVRAHGGTIWVTSTPGEGSTFTFSLPVAVKAPNGEKSDEPQIRAHRG
jgi:NtrC-family two-component system sensor histidine kinase KinB